MAGNSTRSDITPTRRRAFDATVSLAGGVAAVAGSYAAVGLRPSFLAAPTADWVTAVTPDAVITWAILTLGSLGQSLGFVLAIALTVCGVALAVAGSRRLARATDADALVSDVLATLVVGGLTLLLTGGPRSAFGAAVGTGLVLLSASGFQSTAASPASPADRRGFLRVAASAATVVGLGAFLGIRSGGGGGRVGTDTAASNEPTGDPVVDDLLSRAADRTLDLPDLDPLVSRDFYQVDINSVDPDLSADDWSLRLTGAVDEERTLSYDELTAHPAEHRFVTLQCVGDALNGKKIDTALWTGVPIETLLPDLPDECCVMLRAADDYFEEFPMGALRNGFLAYRMNGRPLPRGHGRPFIR